MHKRKLILYISMSLDGFLATKDDDLSWLSVVEELGEDYGYKKLNDEVDTYIVGRVTYDTVVDITGGSFPPAAQHKCYVLTRSERRNENKVEFYNGDIAILIDKLKSQKGKHIYCDGGGQVVNLLMRQNLIDEYRISIVPIILGDGKRLFFGETPKENLRLVSCKQFKSGLVQVCYKRVAESE